MSISIPNQPTDARSRLHSHFDTNPSYHNERWSQLWDAGDFLPWDRGGPNPALVDTLSQRQDLLGDSNIIDKTTGAKRRKRALVPGCGKGYDVLLLASFGYDAYGLEVSASAVEMAEKVAKEKGNEYEIRHEEVGRGTVRYIVGDFFKDEWLKEIKVEGKFELIYDYTFLCALPPSMRPAWALRTAQLLALSLHSNLICLEFPTYKAPSTGGPPFGLSPSVYTEHLSHPGKEIPYDEDGNVREDAPGGTREGGLERVAHWQPERTHEIGKGTDWVSIWRHR
ncbi:MAG: hypothetical protein M1812_007201 [Candelaria pacifica]|nr:MAG: hypothetical protein M1812_007201 [Candelaria pacifica]